MDPLRRGAIIRAGKILGGAGIAVSGMGRGNAATAQSTLSGALNTAGNIKSAGQAYNKIPYPEELGRAEVPSPLSQARWKAAEPIHEKIADIEGYGRPKLENFLGRQSTYLHSLRSTSESWRASVQMDQQKRRNSAVKQLQAQLQGILEGPLESLSATVNDAISSFLTELQKP